MRKMGRKIVLSNLLFILISLIGFSPSQGKEATVTLIYSSNTLGEVEPCGTCPETGDNGGLARRSQYIKTVKEEAKHLLILDGGDALVMSYFERPSEREKARRRAEVVLRLYEKIGYDALNIGDTDIGLGVEYLKKLQGDVNIPFLSANLKEKKTGKPVFKPYVMKEGEGVNIGILGLITTEISPHLQKELRNYSIENPIKTAKETITRFMASCDHIIALAHLTPPEIESLAKEVPRISIIVGGNDRYFMFPKHFKHSLYVQTDAFGSHIGKLNLNLVKGASEFRDVLPNTLLQQNIEKVRKRMEDPQFAKEMKNLKELEQALIEQKKRLPDPSGKNTYENFLILMHPGMESDPEVERLINSSRDQLKRPIPY